MKTKRRFAKSILAAISDGKILGIRAYLEKYHTPGSIKYARDWGRAKSKTTTTELVPFSWKKK